jgi:hypothetical protein
MWEKIPASRLLVILINTRRQVMSTYVAEEACVKIVNKERGNTLKSVFENSLLLQRTRTAESV